MSRSKAIALLKQARKVSAGSHMGLQTWIDDVIRELEEEGKDEAVVACARCCKPLGKGTLVSFVPLDNQLHIGVKLYCSAECQRFPWANVKQDGDKGPNGSCPDWTSSEAPIQEYRPKCDWCFEPIMGENMVADMDQHHFCSNKCLICYRDHQLIADLIAWRDKLMQSIGGMVHE